MKIEIVKTDISDSLKYNTSITVKLLRSNDLWKIEVPHTIENNELIHRLSTADDLAETYAEILINEFQVYNYKNEYKSIKKRFICSTSTQLNKAVVLPSTVDISDDFEKYGIRRKQRGVNIEIHGKRLKNICSEYCWRYALRRQILHRCVQRSGQILCRM